MARFRSLVVNANSDPAVAAAVDAMLARHFAHIQQRSALDGDAPLSERGDVITPISAADADADAPQLAPEA